MALEQRRSGRPRSEQARTAVLHAVDDLLVEIGYSALTMTAIAQRAGVGRQTVYRWWSTKAEVLFEAAMTDADGELAIAPRETTSEDVIGLLEAVTAFLTTSDAGAGYRALIGEAQHDPVVAQMMRSADLFERAAEPVLARAAQRGDVPAGVDTALATALLTGPVFFRLFTGAGPADLRAVAAASLAALTALPVRGRAGSPH